MKKSFVLGLFFIFSSFFVMGQVLPEDRQIDWTNAGLRDTTTVDFSIIDLNDFGIIGDGITPNDAILTDVLSNPDPNGLIIKFPEGTFLFNEPINLNSNTVLSGEGADKTVLSFDLGGSGNAIEVIGSSLSSVTTNLISTGQKDSSFLLVADATFFEIGDWIKLEQIDAHLVTSTWALGTVGQIIQIKDIIDNKIYLKSTLRKTYLLEDAPKITKVEPVENVGISCLKINRIDNTAPSQSSNIRFIYAVNSWVSSIESSFCTFSHIDVRFSSNLKIEKSYLHDAFDFGGGGRAYGIMLHFMSNEILIENNIFKRLRHSMILQAGTNGNVFSFNYSYDPFWTSIPSNSAGDIVLHGNYIFANLFEQNIVQNMVIDNSHGPNGPNNTFFRNRGELYGIFFSATNSPGQNFIGNEITNTGFPFNIVNYNIIGANHFLYGNNNKGSIDPPGTDTLITQSLYYLSIPDFVSPDQWAGIGTPNPVGQGEIPALNRVQNNDLFSNTCGQIITNTTEIDEIENHVNIFPNPFSEIANIESEDLIQRIDLIDFSGKIVFTKNYNEKVITLDLDKFPSGIYTALIYLNNNTPSFKKIIKSSIESR